jgi:diguanylate cyclase (GGDEF)-like protein
LNFAFLFEILAPSFELAFRAAQAQYFGGPFTAPLIFLFVCDYCNVKLKRYQIASLFIIPLISLLLVLTWRLNGIYYKEMVFVTDSMLPHLKVTGSIFYYLAFAYILIISLASIIMFLYYFFKRDTLFKKQSVICIIATIIPYVGIVINIFGKFEIDMTPMLSGITCLLFGYNFLMLDFYRIAPVARDQIVENMSDGFVLIDMNDCFIEANFKAKHIFPQLKLASPGIKARDITGVFTFDANGGIHKNDFITVEHEGVQKHYKLSLNNIMNDDKAIARCVMIYDVTETKELLDDVSALAERDSLTGISNRRVLYQRWENLLDKMTDVNRGYGSLSLLMIDVDFFKQVNDIHGHLVGDEVLKTIAEQLSSRFRKSDTVARYGGEEFCVFLSDIPMKASIILARSLREDIANYKFASSRGEFNVTISIGITAFDPNRHVTLDKMIADADAALYAAKNSGRNSIYLARQSCGEESSHVDGLVLECVLNDYPSNLCD